MSYQGQIHNTAICDFIVTQMHGINATYDGLVDDADRQVVDKAAHNIYCATMFLVQCNWQCYGKLVENLENNFTRGNDNYLTTLVQAFIDLQAQTAHLSSTFTLHSGIMERMTETVRIQKDTKIALRRYQTCTSFL